MILPSGIWVPDAELNTTASANTDTPHVSLDTLIETMARLKKERVKGVQKALRPAMDKPITPGAAETIAFGRRFESPFLPAGVMGFTDGVRFVFLHPTPGLKLRVTHHRKTRKGRRQ